MRATLSRSRLRTYAGIIRNDLSNVLKYGPNAPRRFETIWVDPAECKRYLDIGLTKRRDEFRRHSSGLVVEFWPWEAVISIRENTKIQCCIQHWKHGVPWSETGIYEHMDRLIEDRGGIWDECRDRNDVVRRYENLDRYFEAVKSFGRIKRRGELYAGSIREEGGIQIHIGPGGEPFFGNGGNHRLAMSLIIGVPFPAVLSTVHRSALDVLDRFRRVVRSPSGS